MNLVIDSSVWIAHFRNQASPAVQYLRTQAAFEDVAVGDLILLEVLQGARTDDHARRIRVELNAFPVLSLLNENLAVAAAQRYRALRAQGVTVRKSNDLLIASYCLEHSCTLLHQDRDFAPFVRHFGLRVAV